MHCRSRCAWRSSTTAQGGTVPSAIARGNVALADHGLTILDDGAAGGLVPARVPADGRYRPALDASALTHAGAFDD